MPRLFATVQLSFVWLVSLLSSSLFPSLLFAVAHNSGSEATRARGFEVLVWSVNVASVVSSLMFSPALMFPLSGVFD